MTYLPLEIDYIGGNCPVQAEGNIDGKTFYFRARGSSWTFYVGDYGNIEWEYSEEYITEDDDPFAAGWISDIEAVDFIEKAASLYMVEENRY